MRSKSGRRLFLATLALVTASCSTGRVVDPPAPSPSKNPAADVASASVAPPATRPSTKPAPADPLKLKEKRWACSTTKQRKATQAFLFDDTPNGKSPGEGVPPIGAAPSSSGCNKKGDIAAIVVANPTLQPDGLGEQAYSSALGRVCGNFNGQVEWFAKVATNDRVYWQISWTTAQLTGDGACKDFFIDPGADVRWLKEAWVRIRDERKTEVLFHVVNWRDPFEAQRGPGYKKSDAEQEQRTFWQGEGPKRSADFAHKAIHDYGSTLGKERARSTMRE